MVTQGVQAAAVQAVGALMVVDLVQLIKVTQALTLVRLKAVAVVVVQMHNLPIHLT
jgi:hypothetical protein